MVIYNVFSYGHVIFFSKKIEMIKRKKKTPNFLLIFRVFFYFPLIIKAHLGSIIFIIYFPPIF